MIQETGSEETEINIQETGNGEVESNIAMTEESLGRQIEETVESIGTTTEQGNTQRNQHGGQ